MTSMTHKTNAVIYGLAGLLGILLTYLGLIVFEWEIFIIGLAGSGLVVLILTGQVKIVFWGWLLSLIVGGRALWIPVGEGTVRIVPFTVILVILLILTGLQFKKHWFRDEGIGFGLIGICVLLALYNSVPNNNWIAWLIPFFLLYSAKYLIHRFIQSREDVERAIKIFVWVCIVITTGGILTYLGVNLGRFLLEPKTIFGGEQGEQMVVAQGFFGTTIAYSITILGALFIPRQKLPIWVKVLMGIILVLGVMVSGKRIAFVSLFLVAMVMLTGLNIGKKAFNILMGAMVVVLIILYAPTGIWDRFEQSYQVLQGGEAGQAIHETRLDRLERGWQGFKENPFLGTGAGSRGWVHNGYIELLGNVGLLAIGLFFWPVFKRLYYGLRSQYELTRLFTFATLFYLLSPFMFEAVLNTQHTWIFFAFFYGMLSTLLEKEPTFRQSNRKQLMGSG